MKNTLIAICCTILVLVVVGLPIYFGATPSGRAAWNNHFHKVHEADDDTNYKTRKAVEDTCRAMIASYEADKLTYEQYKSADNPEKLEWAEQAKIRANKTASTYNNYILKNRYVWRDNIPADIYLELPYVE